MLTLCPNIGKSTTDDMKFYCFLRSMWFPVTSSSIPVKLASGPRTTVQVWRTQPWRTWSYTTSYSLIINYKESRDHQIDNNEVVKICERHVATMNWLQLLQNFIQRSLSSVSVEIKILLAAFQRWRVKVVGRVLEIGDACSRKWELTLSWRRSLP